jgi:hypothetical protein
LVSHVFLDGHLFGHRFAGAVHARLPHYYPSFPVLYNGRLLYGTAGRVPTDCARPSVWTRIIHSRRVCDIVSDWIDHCDEGKIITVPCTLSM